MDSVTVLIAVISLAISTVFQGISTYLQWKKANEPPKDEVWETTKQIICAKGDQVYSDEFAELYFELKFLKEHPEDLEGYTTIHSAMKAKRDAQATRQEPDN